MRYEHKLTEFLFPFVRHVLRILSAIQVYQFYEMCLGIKNNPVHSLGIIKLCM
jgi:hypothetical protein